MRLLSNRQLSIFKLLLVLGFFLTINSGCSGGGGGDDTTVTKSAVKLSGVVQKGLYIDGTISAQKVDTNGSIDSAISTATINDKGTYALGLSWKGLTLLSAEGHFVNEYTNQNSDDTITLYSLIDTSKTTKINLNLLTSLEYYRVITLMKEGISYEDALVQTKVSLKDIFGLSLGVHSYDLNIYDNNETLKDDNLNLLLLSATFLKIAYEEESAANPSPARLALPMNLRIKATDRLFQDFSKNGRVDGLFQKDWSDMILDDADATLRRASDNLEIEVGDGFPYDPDRWITRLLVDVSTPDYIFNEDGELLSITYRLSIPQENFFNQNDTYDLTYSTTNGSAIAGSDYTSTSGSISFGYYANTHTLTIPVLRRTETEHTFTLNLVSQNSRLTVPNPELEVVIPSSSDFGQADDLSLRTLALRNVIVNTNRSSVAASDDVVLIGDNSSDTRLILFYESRSSTDIQYRLDVYATTGDDEGVLLRPNILIRTVDWYFSNWSFTYIQKKNITVDVSDELKTYLKAAYDSGKEVTLKAVARVRGVSIVEEYPMPKLVQISQDMQPRTTIVNSSYLSPRTQHCQPLSIDPDFSQTTQYASMDIEGNYLANGANEEIPVTYTNVCVTLTYDAPNNQFIVSLKDGEGILSKPIQTTIGGNIVEINATIDENSINANTVELNLPRGYSFHALDTDSSPIPRGESSITLQSGIITYTNDRDLSGLQFAGNVRKYLHVTNLPFYFYINDYSLTNSEFSLQSNAVKYAFDYANSLVNNSGRFSEPLNENNILIIDENGATASNPLSFANTISMLNYPSMVNTLDGFSISLVDGKLVNTDLGSADNNISTLYLQSCQSLECPSSLVFASLHVDSTQTTLFSDGSLISSSQTPLTSTITWGDKDGSRVFERNDDAKARVYLPGFELPTNKDNLIMEHILGSAQQNGNNIVYHSLSDSDAKDGKHLFAGINLGSFTDSTYSLDGTSMKLALGDEQNVTVNNSAYTKYYLRRSGITGVFNNIDGEVLEPVVYGYNMVLDDFKFRQVSNLLDPYSQIGGSVEVIGKGDFTVLFKNLALDCSGNFKNGRISKEQNEVILSAWKTPSALTTIDFSNQEENVCSNNKSLFLGHVVSVAALKNRIGLNTFWTSKGVPEDSTIISSTHNKLDGNETDEGYNLSLRNISFKSYSDKDWIESDAAFGLPFWGATEMSMRLQNENNTTRFPSVVTARGELSFAGSSANENKVLAQTISKNYRQQLTRVWAKMIDLSLPVYYDASSDVSKRPTFLGRKLNRNLIVLKADAGINYVTPEATAMSFGASANFAALKGLKLHVDLSDPDSLKEIDETIEDYITVPGTTKGPLQDTIGVLLENINIGNKLLKTGMSLAMEEAAMFALREAGDLAPLDPFEELAAVNAKIYATPVVLKDKVLEIFETNINTALNMHQDNLATLGVALTEPLSQYYELLRYLNDANTTIHAIPEIGTLLAKTKMFVFENGFGGLSCSWSNFTKKGFFKPIGTATNSIIKVNKEMQNFKLSKIESFAKKANKFTGLDSDDLVSTAKKVQELSNDFKDLVDDLNSSLETHFRDSLCPGFETGMTAVDEIYSDVAVVDRLKVSLENNITSILATLQSTEVKKVIASLEEIVKGSKPENFSKLKAEISASIIAPIRSELDPMINDIQSKIPNLQADDLRRMVVSKIFEIEAVQELNAKLNKTLDPIADSLNKLALKVFSGFDKSLNKLLAKVSDAVNKVLAKATSTLDKIPLAAGSMDGYATFYGDSLARLHVGSEFKVTGKDEDSSFGFNAALDVENDDMNDSLGCGGGDKSKTNLRAAISTTDITMPLGTKKLKVDYLMLGVTIAADATTMDVTLKGIFGGIESKSGFDFDTFKLYNLGLETGIGVQETYLGAKANATMDDLQLGVSFLVGQVCNRGVISRLVPKAIDDFITIPNNKFNGALVFGEGQMPIWKNGCALTVTARAKLGTWFIFGPPKTFGGIVGGGAFGKALCIATLGGEVEVLAEKSGDLVRFQGSGWGAAGVGSCDNSWSSVSDSRSDSWCGTGDAKFGALYSNGWELLDIRTSAVH